MIRKGYSDGPFGQVHWRIQDPETASFLPDLYCLHPAPFSGLAFTTIMPHLARDRRVIAPDYPGHGGSDAFKPNPSIKELAEAMLAVAEDLSGEKPIDLMGFHTGSLVAVDMALCVPERIRKLALVDVPAFDAVAREKYKGATAKPFEVTTDLHCLEQPWDRGMTKRLDSQGLGRSFEMFVEQLRHGRNMNAAFHAGFTYNVEDKLPMVRQPALVLASQSALLDASRRAAKLIPSARLLERLDIKRAVLDEAAKQTAQDLISFFHGADA